MTTKKFNQPISAFERANCQDCKHGMAYEYDHGDGELKSVYRCEIQKEINDHLCEGTELSERTSMIILLFEEHHEECPNRKV